MAKVENIVRAYEILLCKECLSILKDKEGLTQHTNGTVSISRMDDPSTLYCCRCNTRFTQSFDVVSRSEILAEMIEEKYLPQ